MPTKLFLSIFSAPNWVGQFTTPMVALVKSAASTTHLLLIAPGRIAALSALTVLIVFGRDVYASAADRLEGANDASRISWAECSASGHRSNCPYCSGYAGGSDCTVRADCAKIPTVAWQ